MNYKNRKRIKILERDNWKCRRCGEPLFMTYNKDDRTYKVMKSYKSGKRRAVFHHIVHKQDGGTDRIDNLISSCKRCETEYHREDNKKREEMKSVSSSM
jgi:5-methylcytosine-specific restriction endonuclease McrA